MKKKKINHGEIVLFAKSKLNSIKVLTSKALIVLNISYKSIIFPKCVKEIWGYQRRNRTFKNFKNQSEILGYLQNLAYCLQFRKKAGSKKKRIEKTKNGKIMLSSNCAVVIVKNQDLLKSKKLVDY